MAMSAEASRPAPESETSWRLFRTPGEAWAAMAEDCRAARRTIDVEQYIFTDDEVGRGFLELFRHKARQGVRVRILADMFGSLSFYRAFEERPGEAAEPAVRFYNPVSPWRITRAFSWSRRDHRKLMVLDSEVGYTGGAGLAGWMRPWRDTTVHVRGPVARAMERAVDQLWRGAEGRSGEPDVLPPERPDAPFRVVTNTPHPHHNRLYQELRDGVRGAAAYAFLTTPYFMPNPAFFRALLRAARRGVDVRLLLPGENDVALMAKVGESYYGRALKAGVRIFLYQGEILHTKAAVIDDRWATVGSANLDYLSFFGNHEANLVATEPAFVAAMRADFLADLENSREVRRDEWRRSWHPTATLIGRCLRLARKFA